MGYVLLEAIKGLAWGNWNEDAKDKPVLYRAGMRDTIKVLIDQGIVSSSIGNELVRSIEEEK